METIATILFIYLGALVGTAIVMYCMCERFGPQHILTKVVIGCCTPIWVPAFVVVLLCLFCFFLSDWWNQQTVGGFRVSSSLSEDFEHMKLRYPHEEENRVCLSTVPIELWKHRKKELHSRIDIWYYSALNHKEW